MFSIYGIFNFVSDEEYPELTQSQPPENVAIKSSKVIIIIY